MRRPKHIHTVRAKLADGSLQTYYYHRRTRKRITGPFGSEEFFQSYVEANKVERITDRDTLGGLIQQYRQSRDFKSKAARTRKDYEEQLLLLRDAWADMPLDVMTARAPPSSSASVSASRSRVGLPERV